MSSRADVQTLKESGVWERVQECCWRKLGENYGYVCDYHEGWVDAWEATFEPLLQPERTNGSVSFMPASSPQQVPTGFNFHAC